MSIASDEHSVKIGTSSVEVTARTGPVHATWKLLLDGDEADRASAAGDVTLRGSLPDGSPVVAHVHQSLFGPTEVVVEHDTTEVATFRGFVL